MNCDRSTPIVMFLTGLGAGIALTALLAPRSGAATRHLVARKVEEGEGWLKDKAAAAQECAKSQGEELLGRVKGLAGAITRS